LLDRLRATETVSTYTLRAWTGVATDEGIGLITMIEVCDERGVPVCSFQEFLADSVRREDGAWPRAQDKAASALQGRALDRARSAVLAGTLQTLHGHRYDIEVSAPTPRQRPGS
jgi:hypothetical protein